MYSYFRTYQLAISLARESLLPFTIPIQAKASYAIKSGNLAISFLGFSAQSNLDSFRRSAQLGVLAATFDLVSDGLQFDPNAISKFENIVRQLVNKPVADLIFNLLDRKLNHLFRFSGLERGVDALQIVIKHLGTGKYWPSEEEIYETGILCQIVDDVLDFESDVSRQELNFLRHPEAQSHLLRLKEWDYRAQFSYCANPLVLFNAIKRAQIKAERLEIRFLPKMDSRATSSVIGAAPRDTR